MIPIIYSANEETFSTLGEGILPDCISCTAVEEIESGKNECEFSYPITGTNYSLIAVNKIVKIKPNENSASQLFRVYKATKPINGIVKFYCQHISYDLCTVPVEPIGYFGSITQYTLFTKIKSHYKLPDDNTLRRLANRFTFTNYQATKTKAIAGETPRSARSWLGGGEGSFLDVFGGEFEFDNFEIKLHETRGNDNGVAIIYGKNMTNLSADIDIQSSYDRIYAYAIDSDGNYHETTDLVEIPNSPNYGTNKTLILNLSDKYENGETITESDLISKALSYAAKNGINQPISSVKVSFVQLWQSKEYENLSQLERVSIGDIVKVVYPELGVSSTLRVVKTVYDCLNEKYTSIELGKAKQTVVKLLSNISRDVDTIVTTQQTAMQAAAAYAAEKITGGMGGYVVINPNESTGYPEEILIMDNPDISQAINVWRWNSGGLGHSSNGYNSQSYDIAMTADGKINADMITTGALNAGLIKTGVLQDESETTSIDMSTGTITISQNDSRGAILLSADGIFFNLNDSNKMRLFVQRNGNPIIVCEGAPLIELGTGFKIFNNKVTIGEVEIDHGEVDNNLEVGSLTIGSSTQAMNGNYLKSNRAYQSTGFSVVDSNDIEVGALYANSNGEARLKMGLDNFKPINVTINGTNYTLLGT